MTGRVKASPRGARYALRRKLYYARSLVKSASPKFQAPADNANQQKADQELLQLREMVLRQRAEFDNYRKRTQREKDQVRDGAAENVFSKLLPVIDNMERALASAETASEVNPVREGVRMILTQLNRALEAEGLIRVHPLNQPFDPNLHDAIATEERAGVPDNHVCEVLLPGYQYKEKLVRAAMVKVSKAPQGEKINAGE